MESRVTDLEGKVVVITGGARGMGAAMGVTNAPKMLLPEHVVPLVLYLASRDASQVTGKLCDVVQWNLEHGLGGRERWEVPADLAL